MFLNFGRANVYEGNIISLFYFFLNKGIIRQESDCVLCLSLKLVIIVFVPNNTSLFSYFCLQYSIRSKKKKRSKTEQCRYNFFLFLRILYTRIKKCLYICICERARGNKNKN